MKKLVTVITILFLGFLATSQTKNIDTEKSIAKWKAYQVLGGNEGIIKFKSGYLLFKKDKLRGGSFVVDMNTIEATSQEGGGKTRLENHLKNEDFFNVEKYPTSVLMFKKIKTNKDGNYTITADLTIKEVKKSITFDINVKSNSATATLNIDRKLFNLTYGSDSSLGNKMIKNNFDVEVSLAF